MSNYNSLSPIPADYEKKGHAARVDAAVQDALDDKSRTDEILTELRVDLENNENHRNEAVAAFEVARRYSQATLGLASFAILAHAFPRMSEWYQEHGTLVRADDPSDPIAVGSRWMQESIEYVTGELRAQEDPLAEHLEVSKKEVNEAYPKWKATPIGQNSWPTYPEGFETGTIDSLLTNVALASDSLTAFSVYAAVHRGIRSPDQADELINATRAEAVPRMTWWSTAHRHLARTQENVELVKTGRANEGNYFIPCRATTLLMPESIARLGLAATVRKFTDQAMARDPHFCPHASLANGPVENAWHCAGSVIARYSDPSDQVGARIFFKDMGIELGRDERLCIALAVTSMMAMIHRDTVQPEWLKIAAGQHPDIESDPTIFEEERRRLLPQSVSSHINSS